MENVTTIVFGMGRSGISALKLLNHLGEKSLALNSPPVEEWVNPEIQANSTLQMSEADFLDKSIETKLLMILSPGIPRTHHVVQKVLAAGGEVISEIELGYRHWKSKVIALTGTNGKTTTVSLLDSIFNHAGVKVFTGGNIGIPFCDGVLDQLQGKEFDVALLELSSFQLESMESFRPDIAAILNLSMSHGERYPNLAPYREAKFHLMDKMTSEDILFCAKELEDDLPAGSYQTQFIEDSDDLALELESFLQLPGHHNLLNLAFAEALGKAYGLNAEQMKLGVLEFRGVPHRLEKLDCPQMIYNDSKSTNWVATHSALCAVEKPIHLILGGQLRMKDSIGIIQPVVDLIHQKVEKLWFYGEAAEFLAKEFEGFPFETHSSLNELIPKVISEAKDANLVFSPGFPSFDLYKNYEERGEDFKRLINEALG